MQTRLFHVQEHLKNIKNFPHLSSTTHICKATPSAHWVLVSFHNVRGAIEGAMLENHTGLFCVKWQGQKCDDRVTGDQSAFSLWKSLLESLKSLRAENQLQGCWAPPASAFLHPWQMSAGTQLRCHQMSGPSSQALWSKWRWRRWAAVQWKWQKRRGRTVPVKTEKRQLSRGRVHLHYKHRQQSKSRSDLSSFPIFYSLIGSVNR